MKIPDAGLIIRQEMMRWGYTVETLSLEADISVPVLQGILRGRTETISTRNICNLARTFHYSAQDFIDLLHGHKN